MEMPILVLKAQRSVMKFDNDCDGLVDDEDDSVNASNGNTSLLMQMAMVRAQQTRPWASRSLPEGYSEFDTDCNDSGEDLDGDGGP